MQISFWLFIYGESNSKPTLIQKRLEIKLEKKSFFTESKKRPQNLK